MADKKIIAVLGATGSQGGGLVRAILNDPDSEFIPRALTRDASSDKAQALRDQGAEVVEADVDDVESLKQAFDGAYGVYAVTFFWDHFSPEKEIAHAKNIAEAARAANVQHVIWSTLEDTREWVPLDDDRMPTLQGKYKVPHFDSKGEGDRFFRELGVPTTFLLTTFYWDNMIHFGVGPQPGPDGTLAITFPIGDQPLAGIAAVDIGKCAYGIFKAGDEYIGKTVGIAGELVTGEAMAAGLSEALGQEVRYNDVSPETYRGFGFPGADDLGNMFQFYRDFSGHFRASRNVDEARRLNPELQSYDDWLAANKDRIPVGAEA